MTRGSGVLVIAGPTASGKTDLAIELAQHFNAEIVNADSRQVYAGMGIGTAAPTPAQLARVPHHLVGFLDPAEQYSAARFAVDAGAAIADIHRRGKRVIVAGGSGFYIRALTGDVALAQALDPSLRERLAAEAKIHEPAFLYDWLCVRDKQRASAVHPQDTYRVLRALEVALSAGAGSARPLAPSDTNFLKIALKVDEAELTRRIAERTQTMLSGGFIDEAERIGERAVAANAVGYLAALGFLRGWSTYDELRALLIARTRRYAKRQLTWFRSEPRIVWARADAVKSQAREKLGWV